MYHSGIAPNPPGSFADYTSPTVRWPDGTYTMDSVKIASKVEELYPSPPMRMETIFHVEADVATSSIIMGLLPDFICPVIDDVLQEPSITWFEEDRSRRFGMSLRELNI